MIHTLLTAISTNLPMPHVLLGAITGLLVAASTFLWLKRGSRFGAIMLLALAIGLGALTWGVLKGQKSEIKKGGGPAVFRPNPP